MPPRNHGDADRLRALVDAAERIVFFTGAGISTESGIPDFRSPGTGLWTKMKPIQFQDFVASDAVRQESWRRRFTGERVLEGAQPNAGHHAIARLVATGKVLAVITQNIDNLHQDAGVPAARVIELHGNAHHARCLRCGLRHELADLEREFRETGRVGPCNACGGIVKTATISFGQAMPEDEMARAQDAIEACDLCVVAGSSLQVYPAAGFPEYAKRRGALLAIVNREETPLDPRADLVVRGELGPTLAFVAGINPGPAGPRLSD
ncbi:MAG: Sir2 family NAD-dependent protein deacetylase [Pseudomonadales bacterium]|nr:Sir2 family NAD-dependent protein deacetylase [Pseudomonadales bacterium]